MSKNAEKSVLLIENYWSSILYYIQNKQWKLVLIIQIIRNQQFFCLLGTFMKFQENHRLWPTTSLLMTSVDKVM